MKQNHHARMGMGQNLGNRPFRVRLTVIVPVGVGIAPENGGVALFLRIAQILLGKPSLRRTIKGSHLPSRTVGVDLFQGRKLLAEQGFVGDSGHIRMLGRMIADQMPFLRHPTDQRGIALDQMLQDKKCSLGVVLLQGVQNLFHISVFVSGVKGQIQHLFTGTLVEIYAVIILQKRQIGIQLRLSVTVVFLEIPIVGGGFRRFGSCRQSKQQKQSHCPPDYSFELPCSFRSFHE